MAIQMKKLIIAWFSFYTIIFLALLAVLFVYGVRQYDNQLDPEGSYGAECPPQVITAKSIKANAIDYTGQKFETMTKIKLPESVVEIQIGDDVFKKEKYNPDNFILEEEIFKKGK